MSEEMDHYAMQVPAYSNRADDATGGEADGWPAVAADALPVQDRGEIGEEGQATGNAEIGGDDAAVIAPASEPSIRERLLQEFIAWLDRTLAGEDAPAGLPAELLAEAGAIDSGHCASDHGPAEHETDLYSLYSALTALTGEIRLQGRAFRQVSDVLAPLAEFPAGLAQLENAQLDVADRLDTLLERTAPPEKGLPSSPEVVSVFLDLYDRLKRGLRTFESGIEALRSRRRTGWLTRLMGASAQVDQAVASAEAMGEGYRLTLARLEAALGQWAIERIGHEGEAFDPRLMTAVEVQPAPGVPDGTVLEVSRSGYMLRGKVIATAQVRVSKT